MTSTATKLSLSSSGDQSESAQQLVQDLNWMAGILNQRLIEYGVSLPEEAYESLQLPPADLSASTSFYAEFIKKHEFNDDERLILVLALAPMILPGFADGILEWKENLKKNLSFIGGKSGESHRGFIPTIETGLFLVAGASVEQRLKASKMFEEDHPFTRKGILKFDAPKGLDPQSSTVISPALETYDRITCGKHRKPKFDAKFPAEYLTTEMEWEDLVLPPGTNNQLNELLSWLRHSETLLQKWGMSKRIKPGYRALFYGPPGTGKSLTATLLGKQTDRDVYRIDLSKVVSKYIGETEKNLSNIFDRAEHKDWILFFDEADALFGKRTNVKDSHDRYANQEVSYLLQRVEAFNGLVILATNLKSNLDDAFIRRFQSIVHFPLPKSMERKQLWEKSIPEACDASKIDVMQLANDFEVSGAMIVNSLQFALIKSLERGNNQLLMRDLVEGIKREFHKEGRTL